MLNKTSMKESVSHGTSEFPAAAYIERSLERPGAIVPCHWHEEMEVMMVSRGPVRVLVDTTEVLARTGDVFIFPGGQLHAVMQHENDPGEIHAVVFSSRLIGSASDACGMHYILPFMDGKLTVPAPLPRHPLHNWALAVTQLFYWFREQPAGYELYIRAGLFDFFARLISEKYLAPVSGTLHAGDHKKTERIKKVLAYIDQHYREPVSNETLAEVAGLSQFHFCRFFKTFTGSSPVVYMNRLRVERAAELLSATRLPGTDIALECGFSNFSYFIKTFRTFKGVTPQAFRKTQGTV